LTYIVLPQDAEETCGGRVLLTLEGG